MKFGLGLFFMTLLFACTSKTQKWALELRSFQATSDSVSHVLNQQIDTVELAQTIETAASCWQDAKSHFSSDTLDLETLDLLDAFNVAYSNGKNLVSEYTSCNVANKQLKKRLALLQSDIQNGNGNRSTYCASITKEKEELTIIRNHAMDIRRRFEELKSSMEQFQPLLARF
jgi:hypothetical protein